MTDARHRPTASTRGRILVWGMLGSFPFGGMFWQVVHHLEALRRLGYDVWYVEDSRIPLGDPEQWGPVTSAERTVAYLGDTLARFGFADRWVLRTARPDAIHGGLDEHGLAELYATADAVLNLCGAHFVREEHAVIRNLVMIETDPGHPQVAIATGQREVTDQYTRHHHRFTYAANLGAPDCGLPIPEFEWHPTRPPVVVDLWDGVALPAGAAFTTVAAWRSAGKDVVWRGRRWSWSKHHEFERILDLPSRSDAALEIAISGATSNDETRLRAHGWRLRSALELGDPFVYRRFVQQSAGEVAAAKEQYVVPRSGWFSDRTVCYLAAGRPAIVQDTGLRSLLPHGEGLFLFTGIDDAAAALDAVRADPQRHARAAREIAAELFCAERVVQALLTRIGAG